MDVLATLFRSLEEGHNEEALGILEVLNLSRLEEKLRQAILLRCLQTCHKSGNLIACSAIISGWKEFTERMGRNLDESLRQFVVACAVTSYRTLDNVVGKDILSFLELDTLGEEEQRDVVILCIEACEASQNTKGCRELVAGWEDKDLQEGQDVVDRVAMYGSHMVLAEMFLWPGILPSTLAFVIASHPEVIAQEILTELVQMDTTDNVRVALSKVIAVMGEQDYDTYQQLEDLATLDENQNQGAVEWCQGRKDDIAPSAPLPSYLRDYGLHEEPQIERIEVNEELTNEEIADMLTETIVISNDADAAANRARLMEQISAWDPETRDLQVKKLLLTRAILSRTQNVDLFRYYGPVNAAPSADYTQDHVCTKFGGCRMFLCQEFTPEHDDIDQYGVDGWFTGNCEVCSRKIEQKEAAVRIPLVSGGWKGCFCSWGCVEEATEDHPDSEIIDRMIDIVEKQLDETGIQNKNFS